MSSSIGNVGIVVIGRNEGERLVRCLRSLSTLAARTVYVDSCSSDGSQAAAAALGVHVIELRLDKPFTAGRARNTGFKHLLELFPTLDYVQFVDGDCEIDAEWIAFARDYLEHNAGIAIVCGRRKERFPEKSIYNTLCDLEWDTPVGVADACGGDFLVRAHVFSSVEGFDERLIAGEEPEMCYRMRKVGWHIYRADKLMTIHDAAMTRFGQWARRTSRSGYAYAARAAIHFRDGRHYCWRENIRNGLWAVCVPLAILGLTFVSPWFLLLLLLYVISYLRTARRLATDRPVTPALKYSLFLVIGKWPEFYGQLLFLLRWLRGQEQRIIEYK